MIDPKLKPIISVLIAAALIMIVSIPLIFKKIPPNCAYGFRLKKTLSNREIWFNANEYGGRCFMFSGLITMIGCMILLLNIGRLSFSSINNLSLTLLIAPLMISIFFTLAYIKKL